MVNERIIARPYARAAFLLAQEQKKQSQWGNFLKSCSELVLMTEFRKVLFNPRVDKKQIFELFIEVVPKSLPKGAKEFLSLLIEEKRAFVLDKIYLMYRDLQLEEKGELDVELTVASELTKTQVSSLKKVLETYLSSSIVLNVVVDANIIGGVIAKVHNKDLVIDSSVRGKLNQLASSMLEVY